MLIPTLKRSDEPPAHQQSGIQPNGGGCISASSRCAARKATVARRMERLSSPPTTLTDSPSASGFCAREFSPHAQGALGSPRAASRMKPSGSLLAPDTHLGKWKFQSRTDPTGSAEQWRGDVPVEAQVDVGLVDAAQTSKTRGCRRAPMHWVAVQGLNLNCSHSPPNTGLCLRITSYTVLRIIRKTTLAESHHPD